MTSRLLYDPARLALTLQRLAYAVREHHPDFYDVCLVGLQPRGVYLSRRIHKLLAALIPESTKLPYGELDITFYRDDFRRQGAPTLPNATTMDFEVENKTVILIDDVLYTGRTIRAAMDALLAFGRPKAVELLVLIDRKRMRELPIEPYYSGIAVETRNSEKVLVEWQEKHGADSVRIQSSEPQPPADHAG